MKDSTRCELCQKNEGVSVTCRKCNTTLCFNCWDEGNPCPVCERIYDTECIELVEAYEAYIKLLCDEIKDLASFAITHGWTSKHFEEGMKARLRIKEAKENLPF